jgi:hypothetical protein
MGMVSTTVRLIARIKRMDMVVLYSSVELITKENGMMVNVVEKVVRCL